MTISAFCRDQLLTRGPLPLETLTDAVVGAGKTTARTPTSSVRSALAYKEVLLADGRWATPLWLLEGRILTARRLPLAQPWQEEETDDPLAYNPNPDPDRAPDGSRHDLALLDLALRSGPVPLATGGSLRSSPYGGGWQVPKGWPGRRPPGDQLLGLRVREGQLHVELVPVTDELHSAGQQLARELEPLTADGHRWLGEDTLVSDSLADVLWNRMAADAEFLTTPVAPFSLCIPTLARAVRREHDRRVEEANRWRPQLDLPAALQRVAVQEAWRNDQMQEEWLNSFVARALRKISDVDDVYAEVVPLQRDRWC